MTLQSGTGFRHSRLARLWRRLAVAIGSCITLDDKALSDAPFIDSISMEVAPDADIIVAAGAVCRAEGLPEDVLGVPFGSDASKMTRAGIPTIIFGPGSIDQAHTADEFVSIAEVARAARMLVEMAHRFNDLPNGVRE